MVPIDTTKMSAYPKILELSRWSMSLWRFLFKEPEWIEIRDLYPSSLS